jgi:hypothetical protein
MGVPTSIDDLTRVASDPASNVLWASSRASDIQPVYLTEIDTRGRSKIRTISDINAATGADLYATPSGVWAHYATGLMSATEYFTNSSGTQTLRIDSDMTNSTGVAFTPTRMWFTDVPSLGGFGCANLKTGQVLEQSNFSGPEHGRLVVDAKNLYLQRAGAIQVYRPASRCRSPDPTTG